MRLLSVVAVLLGSACASETALDAVELRMTMTYVERAVRPIPGDPPRTFIDGVERSTFEVEYTSADDVTKHIVELRLDNTTIRTLQVSLDSFGDRCKSDGQMQSIVQEIC